MDTTRDTTRLQTIVLRQRRSRVRDLAFAALVVIAGGVALSSVSTAAQAAHAAAPATAPATGQPDVSAR